MSTFQYGDLTISVESLRKDGDWEEFGIKATAPGHPTYSFRVWHPEERDLKIVAQVFLYDLIEAYEDPHQFRRRKLEWARMPHEKRSPEGTRDFLRAAVELEPFLQQAHFAVYNEQYGRGVVPPGHLTRSPREWMPPKRKG
jgi:hypothetical protein